MSEQLSGQPDQQAGVTGRAKARYAASVNDERRREEREPDILDIWIMLWRGKWKIIFSTLIFAAVGTVYALTATQWYRAEVVLAPASEEWGQSIRGQFGDLASLAGINVGSGTNTAEALAVARSKELTRNFIQDLGLMPVLLADDWDEGAQQWKGDNPEDWPDVRDAVRYFDEQVREVSEDKKTGLVTVAIEWTDAVQAATWANTLVERVNERMRARALVEAERNVQYLQEELAATTVLALQQTLGRILETEMQKLMLARGNKQFAFRVLDPASPPKFRSWPKRTVTVIASALLGALLGSFGVLLQNALDGRRARKSES